MIEEELKVILSAVADMGSRGYKVTNACKQIFKKYNNLNDRMNNKIAVSVGAKINYNDLTEKCVHLMRLHGYQPLDLETTFKDDFINWYIDKALKSPKYRPDLISNSMLTQFASSFYLFKLEYDREPDDYGEIRNWILNWETISDDNFKEQLKLLTDEG